MENKELVEFIKEARKRGFGDLTIKNALITKGWPEKVIEEGFKAVDRKNREIL
jgi:SOS response regulatory protein OraA/RecX